MKHQRSALAGLLLATASLLSACSNPSPMPDPQPSPSATKSAAAAARECDAVANGYCFGFSTYYVAKRRGDLPRDWGNAASWYQNAQRDGYKVGTTPKKGAIAWTDAGPYGDVAYVEDVTADGAKVRVSSMNYNAWNRVTYRVVAPTAFKAYIY